MHKLLIIITLALFFNSCELIVIGTKSTGPKIVKIDQNSSLGAVYLFKTELDSNNTLAASQILANSNGNKYLAIDKYNKIYEIKRIKRIISNKPITAVSTDTISQSNKTYNIVFDYLEILTFETQRINNKWFITNISNWKEFTQNHVTINKKRF